MIRPYIGITDFTKPEEVERMLAVFKKHAPAKTKHILHVGVMMSRKTLNHLPTSFAAVFPKNEDVAGIFHLNDVLNCLHYADYSGQDRDLAKNLTKALAFGGDRIHALQLDMVWPDPDSVAEAVKGCGKPVEVILQIGKGAFDQVDDDPDLLVEGLAEYKGTIDRVLFDKSMGRGLGMDADDLLPFIQAVRAAFPRLGLVAAGGLGPDTLHLVEPLVSEFPDLSIDAEGCLRPSRNIMDPIDWKFAETYLAKAIKMLA